MPSLQDLVAAYFCKSGQYRNRRPHADAWVDRAFAKYGF
jgi:hypothetical protein